MGGDAGNVCESKMECISLDDLVGLGMCVLGLCHGDDGGGVNK